MDMQPDVGGLSGARPSSVRQQFGEVDAACHRKVGRGAQLVSRFIASALAGFIPHAALGQEPVAHDFKSVTVGEVWSVYRAVPSGNCVMEATDRNETHILFIRYPDKSTGVIFQNKNWQSLSVEDGNLLRVGLNTDPYSLYPASVGSGYIVARFGPLKLRDIFTNQQIVALYYKDKNIAILNTGSLEQAALNEVDRCAGYSDDPFQR